MNDQQHRERRGGILGWIVRHPKTTAALTLLALLILAATVFDTLAEHRLQRRLDAIRATGAPVTVEDLNAARLHIPDEENMAVLLKPHWERMSALPIHEGVDGILPCVGYAPRVPTGSRLPAEQREAADWYLYCVSEELAGIHAALELERGCIPIYWTSPAMDCALSDGGMSMVRLACKLLYLEVVIAAEDGDRRRAGEIPPKILHLSTILECRSTVIGSLLQMACISLACGCIESSINLCGLDPQTLELLQQRLQEHEVRPDMRRAYITERACLIDMLNCFLHPGSTTVQLADDLGTASIVWRLLPGLAELDEAEALRLLTAAVEAIDGPSGDAIRRVAALAQESYTMPRYRPMSRIVLMSLVSPVMSWCKTVGLNRACQAAIACERYRLANGRWPADLAALVPEYLDEVPADPFDEKPIRYAIIPEGVAVWSIGQDMEDDGGAVGRLVVKDRPPDFGWVILNPELRGRPAEE